MPLSGWSDIPPGAHLALLTGDEAAGIEGRRIGLELRDTILVLQPGPRASFIFIFRKPLQQSTVSDQMAKTGTGAINIDACRVGTGEDKGIWPITDRKGRTSFNSAHDGSFNTPGETDLTVGRWPPNVVLVHATECVSTGTKRVKGDKGSTIGALSARKGGMMGSLGTRGDVGKLIGRADQDGLETVAAWECVPGCPVPWLDGQSGELKSGDVKPYARTNRAGYAGPTQAVSGFDRRGDAGGASRFYPQLASEAELIEWIERLIFDPRPSQL